MSQFSQLTKQLKTPLTDTKKADFLVHINEEHQDELAMFIQAFANVVTDETTQLRLTEVYKEGLDLNVYSQATTKPQTYFLAFINPIEQITELKDQYIALMQKAATKLGKKTIKLEEQSFTLVDSHYVSRHMLRLVLIAPSNTPLTHAGYAYLFDLTTPKMAVTHQTQTDASDHNDTRQHCYYTLRRAWHSPLIQNTEDATIMAWVDVYIHGDTPGGNWARSLQVGDSIKSLREYPEKIEHLSHGQCLLIADETSLPTVARLLETWQNPTPPIIIAICNHADDITYLHNIRLDSDLCLTHISEQAQIIPIINDDTQDISSSSPSLTERIIAKLTAYEQQTDVKIDKVWGALEVNDTKELRKALKSHLNLPRQNMVLKVYWRRNAS
ncbi:siderophore-interacting protein [Psychrobacter sp. I-STPA10]|uniref:siderophore-interacting protein n=1 Tax=Psychrobacter sp. I-STPA10 TaxID=2585769 RepID=UPI001E43FB06|nr:siderophore-interacting protein [Psychrobacter sp. I-STPA10]